jgi:hypothetical protein
MPVKKRIGDATVRILACNGSVPGPTLKVRQGATITVHVANDGDLYATSRPDVEPGRRLPFRASPPRGEKIGRKVHPLRAESTPDAGGREAQC